MLVNNIYFCGEKRAAAQGNEVLKSRMFQQKSSELLPGRVRQDVGEILLREFRAPECLRCLCHVDDGLICC